MGNDDAFKSAEKTYKKRTEPPPRGRKKGKNIVKAVSELDRSEIFDPYCTPTDCRFKAEVVCGVAVYHLWSIEGRMEWCGIMDGSVRGVGCTVIRGALTVEEQVELFHSCWFDFPDPTATTNLSVAYGDLPQLALSAKNGKFLNTKHRDEVESIGVHADDVWSEVDIREPSALSLLKQLRWTSLGPHYNWTTRSYDMETQHRPLPPPLVSLWHKFAFFGKGDPEKKWQPGVALVNYYSEGDTLGGHKDDAEPDLRKPIVCVSLGMPGIFLMGGETKRVAPVPILLRSGDVVVMSDRARCCYHGVPRILNENVAMLDSYRRDTSLNNGDMEYKIITSRVSISVRSL